MDPLDWYMEDDVMISPSSKGEKGKLRKWDVCLLIDQL